MRAAAMVLVLMLIAAGCGGSSASDLVVSTDGGDVRGVHEGTDGTVRAFRGIPFAAPPIGPLRWQPPQPAIPWDGERDAVKAGSMCPQVFSLTPGGGDEDCLFLNVWTPEAPAVPAPVMVWFHGGAFVFGSGGDSYYAGTHLTETHGVVVVTVNYRLGPLGFLAHPALAAEDAGHPTSGNYGIEDQIAALEWVQRNIAAFGGDPQNVTIFGESAGGYSTCAHYMSPRAGVLFHKVISESGLCASDELEQTRAAAEAAGSAFATQLGCSGGDVAGCLRAISPYDLVDAGAIEPVPMQLPGGSFYQGTAAIEWTPNVDGVVIPTSSRDAFAAGGFAPLPLLLGTNRDEGRLFHSQILAKPVADEAEYRAALTRRFGAAPVDAIVQQYPVAGFASANDALVEVSGDAFFVCPARRAARGAAAAGATVHLYSFERSLEQPLVNGVIHGSEIPFVFGIPTFPFGKVGDVGQPLADAIEGYWTRFAATGDPDGDGAVAWPSYDPTGDRDLVLDLAIAAGTGHKTAQCDFWDALPL